MKNRVSTLPFWVDGDYSILFVSLQVWVFDDSWSHYQYHEIQELLTDVKWNSKKLGSNQRIKYNFGSKYGDENYCFQNEYKKFVFKMCGDLIILSITVKNVDKKKWNESN